MKKLAFALLTFLALPALSHAACTNPANVEGSVIYNSTAKMLQFCNGTVWVNAAGINPAAGGGGGSSVPTYAGVTSSAYNGARYGLRGLNAACASDYAGARAMKASDYPYIAGDITNNVQAWVHCDRIGAYSNYWFCEGIRSYTAEARSSQYNLYSNCNGWTSSSYEGMTFQQSSSTVTSPVVNYQSCGGDYKIHCVTD